MKKKKKNKEFRPNWYYTLLGTVLIFFVFLPESKESLPTKVKEIRVSLSVDMVPVKGRKGEVAYRFGTTEYEAEFKILKGSVSTGNQGKLSELKKGQKVSLVIDESDVGKLGSGKNTVTVYGFGLEGKSLLTTQEFESNREKYGTRLSLLSFFLGCMLLLNGTTKIPIKINYILIGIFLGSFLLMRIFEFGIF